MFDAKSAHYEFREHGERQQTGWKSMKAGPTRAALFLFGLALTAARTASAQAPRDSTRPPVASDTARPATGNPATPPPAMLPAASPAPPPDAVLAKACAGESGGAEAPGLLAVTFRAGTAESAQADAARAVGGTVSGESPYGDTYVSIPDNAGPLPLVADRLIRQEPVTTVSPVPCPNAPAPPPAPTLPAAASVPAQAGAVPSTGAMRDSAGAQEDSTAYVPMKGP